VSGTLDPPVSAVREAVGRALAEDLLPLGDLTAALIPANTIAEARFVTRDDGVTAGRACVVETFAQVDPAVAVEWRVDDGCPVGAKTVLGTVRGPLAPIVTGERTALNFLRHLSGIASLTAQFVSVATQASGGHTRILDTRKTTPGLRALEKAAVRAGGGHNHRASLSDAVMVKDTHLAGLSIGEAVARARQLWPGRPVHVECDDLDQLALIVEAGADRAMLDNFTPSMVAEGVELVGGRTEVEVTGGVTLDTVAAYAACRPDFISVGAITHSGGVLDISLDVVDEDGS
jgi:nicotinate-nucleotide pyrophosphorylase (carboxylating)